MLEEKGLKFESKIEKTWERRTDFLKLNPSGEVPVLIDEKGEIFIEHYAISEYLEECYPSVNLIGKTIKEKAEIRRLAYWFDYKFYNEVTKNICFEKIEKHIRRLGCPNSAKIQAGLINIKTHLKYIEWLLNKRNFLAGDKLSLADLSAAAQLSLVDYTGDINWEEFLEAKTWYAKIKSRPSFRNILNDNIPGLPPQLNYSNLDF